MTSKTNITLVLSVGLIAVVAASIWFMSASGDNGKGVQVIAPTATPSPVVVLKAHISGAVRNPGVYEFEDGARLQDLIALAGGTTEDADTDAVRSLAERIRDEARYDIPRVGEPTPTFAASGAGTSPPSGRIDLNTATLEQLMTLTGIGEVRGGDIIRYRETNGPFTSVDQLIEVRGIGPATLDSIRDLVEAR